MSDLTPEQIEEIRIDLKCGVSRNRLIETVGEMQHYVSNLKAAETIGDLQKQVAALEAENTRIGAALDRLGDNTSFVPRLQLTPFQSVTNWAAEHDARIQYAQAALKEEKV